MDSTIHIGDLVTNNIMVMITIIILIVGTILVGITITTTVRITILHLLDTLEEQVLQTTHQVQHQAHRLLKTQAQTLIIAETAVVVGIVVQLHPLLAVPLLHQTTTLHQVAAHLEAVVLLAVENGIAVLHLLLQEALVLVVAVLRVLVAAVEVVAEAQEEDNSIYLFNLIRL